MHTLELPFQTEALKTFVVKNTPKTQKAKSFSDFVLIPERLGINRTLETILVENRPEQQLWHDILVIENNFKLIDVNSAKRTFLINKVVYSIIDNLDGTYSFGVDTGTGNIYLPKYIIIDGQHRFLAFKRQNVAFPFKVITHLPAELEKIVKFVNNFNIGTEGYKQKQIEDQAVAANNPLVMAIRTALSKRTIKVQEDQALSKKKHVSKLVAKNMLDSNYGQSVAYFTKSIRKTTAFGVELQKHKDRKLLLNQTVSPELLQHIDRSIMVLEVVNRLLDGYKLSKTTIIYKFLADLTYNVDFGKNCFATFMAAFEKQLSRKVKKGNKIQSQADILTRAELLFGNFEQEMDSFLVGNKAKYPKFQKIVGKANKYKFVL
jgi:hypothetical protein